MEEVELEARVAARSDQEVRLRFSIHDIGGIAPEVLVRLFSPFTQGDPGITRRHGGAGLGPAISKRLVMLMGGEIGAESLPGHGSTFWFEIPFPLASQRTRSLNPAGTCAARRHAAMGPAPPGSGRQRHPLRTHGPKPWRRKTP